MEQECPGCDEKTEIIRQCKAAIEEHCETSCVYGDCRVPRICAECSLSQPFSRRKYINMVLAGDMPGVPAETRIKTKRWLGC